MRKVTPAVPSSKRMFKYPLIAAALLFVGVVTAMLVDLHNAQNMVIRHTRQVLSDSARQQANTLRALIEGRFSLLETYAAHIAAQKTRFDSATIGPYLQNIAASSDFLRLWMVFPDGSAHSEDALSTNVADRSYFQKAMRGDRAVEMVRGKLNKKPLMIMAVPILRDATPIGVLYGSYAENIFRGFLTPQVYAQRAYSFFCDSKGNIVIASTSEHFLLRAQPSNTIMDVLNKAAFSSRHRLEDVTTDLQTGQQGAIAFTFNGQRRYAVYTPLGINDWFIFNVIPASVIDDDISAATQNGVRLIIIVIIFALLTISLLCLHEYRSLKKLERSKELLRVREEQYRIAAEQSGKDIVRYDILNSTLHQECDCLGYFHFPGKELRVPDGILTSSFFTDESKPDLLAFFHRLRSGDAKGTTVFRGKSSDDALHWYKAEATTVYNDEGQAVQAIISCYDITEEQEKEISYNKWRSRIAALPPQEIKLYTHNLTQDILEAEEGGLLAISTDELPLGMNARAHYAANAIIHPDDRDRYITLLDRDQLLAHYYQRETELALEFQMRDRHDNYRWTRLSVRMLPAQNSSDILAFLLYQDIDEAKRIIMARKRQTELDPLTGIPNRGAFALKVAALLENSPRDAQHAFILLDVDQFKHINTSYGRAVGDATLLNIANILKSVMRRGDIIGRMGGDEFMLCLNNIPYDAAIRKKVRDLSMLMARKMPSGVSLSSSMGIAVYPRDGSAFDDLYKKAVAALQANKHGSRESFTFYHEGLQSDDLPQPTPIETPATEQEMEGQRPVPQKRTILIVDDVDIQRDILGEIFKDDFNILSAVNGTDALRQMRRYGTAISVVLMDIIMPDMTGLEALQKIRQDETLSVIPVIIVSSSGDMQVNIDAIELGASDFVSKPFEPKLIRLRVQNVINRRENELLRIENSYLQLQGEEEERYRQVLYNTGTLVFECDWLNKVYTYDARASKYLAGAYDARPLPQILREDGVASPEDLTRLEHTIARVADIGATQRDQLTIQLKRAQGEAHWFKINIVKTADNFNLTKKLLFTFTDVHTEILAEEKLRYLAEYDSLTKLYNRPTFIEKVQQTLVGQPPNSYVITYFDIDNFKVINDLFGYAEGDRLLQHIAKNISFGDNSIACRISADYFAALYPYDVTRLNQLYRKGKASLNAYALPFEVTFSVGLYVIDDPTLPVEAMLDRATLAQKSIKGKYNARSAYYDENLREQLLAAQEITGSMNTALEQEQFQIYLQPQYNHATGKLVGAETLVRWHHPTKGVLTPAKFMPIFEKNGFVFKLDAHVWEQTCKLLRSWLDTKRTMIPLSVNVSRMDIFHSSFYTLITSLRQKYALPHSLLRLEITESAYGVLPNQLLEMVQKLQLQGFIIEMDDFGSGYSSLNTLKDVPVDILKLDLRFLSDSNGSDRGERILQHVVSMARSLGLSIIAEGVETKQQADYMLSIGCETVQGYYYGKPMPVQEFEAYFL